MGKSLCCRDRLHSLASSGGCGCGTIIASASCGGDEPSDNAFRIAKTCGQNLKTFKHAKIWIGRNEILKIHRYLI